MGRAAKLAASGRKIQGRQPTVQEKRDPPVDNRRAAGGF
jgi:hypothetical protein